MNSSIKIRIGWFRICWVESVAFYFNTFYLNLFITIKKYHIFAKFLLPEKKQINEQVSFHAMYHHQIVLATSVPDLGLIFMSVNARFNWDSETTNKRRDAQNAVSRTHILLPICVGFSILWVRRTADSQ